jgi:excinuclease UvrABC ATPase subunit
MRIPTTLKHLDIDIPNTNLVVITGNSRFGKVLFYCIDTIYTEAQRQQIEMLSTFALPYAKLHVPMWIEILNLSHVHRIDHKERQ